MDIRATPHPNTPNLLLKAMVEPSPFSAIGSKASPLALDAQKLLKNNPMMNIDEFLKTPSGKAYAVALISKEIDKKEQVERIQEGYRRLEERRHKYLLALLSFAMYKKAHARSEKFNQQQEEVFHKIQNISEKQLKQLHAQALTNAHAYMSDLTNAHNALSSKGQDLVTSKFEHENARDYMRSTSEQAKADMEKILSMSPAESTQAIDEKLRELKATQKELEQLLPMLSNDKKDPYNTSTKFHYFTVLDQIKHLENLQEIIKNYDFVNADGSPASSLDAAFTIPKDQKIVSDGEKQYVIPKDATLESMSLEAKQKAHQDFKDLKNLAKDSLEAIQKKLNYHEDKTDNKFTSSLHKIHDALAEAQALQQQLAHEMTKTRSVAEQTLENDLNMGFDPNQNQMINDSIKNRVLDTPKMQVQQQQFQFDLQNTTQDQQSFKESLTSLRRNVDAMPPQTMMRPEVQAQMSDRMQRHNFNPHMCRCLNQNPNTNTNTNTNRISQAQELMNKFTFILPSSAARPNMTPPTSSNLSAPPALNQNNGMRATMPTKPSYESPTPFNMQPSPIKK